MELPQTGNARDFYRSPAFSHGLIIVSTLQDALDQLAYVRQFYTPGMLCGSIKQLRPVKHDERKFPYSIDLRAHVPGEFHGWDRDGDGHQAGQSMKGWKMARDMMNCLGDRDEGLALRGFGLEGPNWDDFSW